MKLKYIIRQITYNKKNGKFTAIYLLSITKRFFFYINTFYYDNFSFLIKVLSSIGIFKNHVVFK